MTERELTQNTKRGWRAIRSESFARLVFFRGGLQFGALGVVFFALLSAIRGDEHMFDHIIRSVVAFPLMGMILGIALWAMSRLLSRLESRGQSP